MTVSELSSTAKYGLPRAEVLRALVRKKALKDFATFFQLAAPSANYKYGRHTLALLAAVQHAKDSLEAGVSTYQSIHTPPRHGKSDIVERRAAPWWLLSRQKDECILAGYSDELMRSMSVASRECYRAWAPFYGVGFGEDDRKHSWTTTGGGGVYAVGLGGTVTGKGAHLLIIGDYLKNREEADSQVIRDKVWEGFTNALMTRLAPVHAVIIAATRWHEDDLVGRIKRRNSPEEHEYDPDFPKFEDQVFSAKQPDGTWLFPQRFGDTYYRSQESVLGTHGASCLMDGRPTAKGGNKFSTNNIMYVDGFPDRLQWYRGWDIAGTEKQTMKDDPDFTVGTKAAYRDGSIFVDDVVYGQWGTTERNKKMVECAERDGPNLIVRIEGQPGVNDCYQEVRSVLSGKAVVRCARTGSADKVARAGCLEPAFDAGRVFLRRAAWNKDWVSEFASFPGGRHDDQVDSLVAAIRQDILASSKFVERT